jgi:hypothetical protein
MYRTDVFDQLHTFSAVFPGGSTKYSLNNEIDGLRAGFIIVWRNNSLYYTGKRSKIPGLQFVAYPTTTTELFRLKSFLKLSEIIWDRLEIALLIYTLSTYSQCFLQAHGNWLIEKGDCVHCAPQSINHTVNVKAVVNLAAGDICQHDRLP